jgi:hypothetical protein
MTDALPLDRIDRRILFELMRDATLPVSQLAERAHGIRGADEHPDRRAEGMKRRDRGPCQAPGRGDQGVFSGPFLLEGIQLAGGIPGCRRLANRAEIGCRGLADLPGAEVHRMPDQVNDAGLGRDPGESRHVAF